MANSKSGKVMEIIFAVGFILYLVAACVDGPFEDDYIIDKKAARAAEERASTEASVQYDKGYNVGYSEGKNDGYESAVEEFCFDGDAQSGGWYEGYEQGQEDYRRAIFNDTEERTEFFYDFFEMYCDSDTFAEYVDSTCAGWREYMPKGRGLR